MDVWIWTLATGLFGRILLAWLPPGEPGGHAARELPATLAAALALGWIALLVTFELARLAGLAPLPLLAWSTLLLGLARLATLPAALRPRHPPLRSAPPRALSLAWLVAVVAALSWAAVRFEPLPGHARFGPGSLPLLLATLTATALVVEECFALTRRQLPGSRLLTLAALLGQIRWTRPEEALHAAPHSLLWALAALGGSEWLRRADERGRMLAVLALLGLGLLDPGLPWIALAGLVALVLFTPAPARAETALLACAPVLLVPLLSGAELRAARIALDPRPLTLLFIVAATLLRPRPRPLPAPPPVSAIAPTTREAALVATWLALWSVGHAMLSAEKSASAPPLLDATAILPLCTIALGLAHLRAEPCEDEG